MLKVKLFTETTKLNNWIEKKKKEDPMFRVDNIQYQPIVKRDLLFDRFMVVYEEETEWEKEKRYKISMEMAKILEGESDD